MNKLDKIGHYNIESGEELGIDVVESIQKEEFSKKIKTLEYKFKEGIINKKELIELMKYKKRAKNVKLEYNNFYTVNMHKDKPEELSDAEYGKFFRILNYVSYKNKLEHSNGRPIKKELLSIHLGYQNLKSFDRFIKKLSKYRLFGKMSMGGMEFLVINPAYAQRNMILNKTVYDLFKEDLKPFLDDYQIRLLELEDEDMELSTIIPFE